MQVQSLGLEDPLEKKMATTPVFLLGKSHGQRNLVGYNPQDPNESDTTEHARTHLGLQHRTRTLSKQPMVFGDSLCFQGKVKGKLVNLNVHTIYFWYYRLEKT